MTSPALLRLAAYGTLMPGRSNHRQMAGMEGRWIAGTVLGVLLPNGWGAALGFPGLIPGEGGSAVPVAVFESADLPAHWARLDAFEGPGYRRVVVGVQTAEGVVEASLYALAEHPPLA